MRGGDVRQREERQRIGLAWRVGLPVALGCSIVAGRTGGAQQTLHQDAFASTIEGAHISVSSSTDPGIQISAGKRPGYVLVAAVLPEAATTWVDSARLVLDAPAPPVAPGAMATLSSGLLKDGSFNSVSLDRVFSTGAPRCTLFFSDGANVNHVDVDLPCDTARLFVVGVGKAAIAQAAYDHADSTSPAAQMAAGMRAAKHQRDSTMAIAAAQRDSVSRVAALRAAAVRDSITRDSANRAASKPAHP
jgi:hypothetical protein